MQDAKSPYAHLGENDLSFGIKVQLKLEKNANLIKSDFQAFEISDCLKIMEFEENSFIFRVGCGCFND